MELLLYLTLLTIGVWALWKISEWGAPNETMTDDGGFEYRTEFESIEDEIAYLREKQKHQGYPDLKVSPSGGLYRDPKHIIGSRLFQLQCQQMSEASDRINKMRKQKKINKIREILNGVDETSDKELRAEGYDQSLINKARGISE